MPFTIKSTALHHLRAKSDRVIKTSWGVMGERHAIFIGLESSNGHGGGWGWGESWVNFPIWSPWERLAAFEQAYLPYLKGREVTDVRKFIADMGQAFLGPAVQAGCVGSLIAELCAVELALWDLEAQSRQIPMNKLWFKNPAAEVEIYASGINSPLPWKDIDAMLAAGVRIFKLKVGFGAEDRLNIEALKKHLGNRGEIAIDANRAWTAEEAAQWLPILRDHNIRWLEEPLRPDHESHYPRLRDLQAVPLSAGENVWIIPGTSPTELADFPVNILQPDITKNCGLSAALDLIPRAIAQNKRVIPHYLGSAVGQAASLHLASGCPDALVEWDINPNPLRTNLLGPDFQIQNGKIKIPTTPGLGWPLDHKALVQLSSNPRSS